MQKKIFIILTSIFVLILISVGIVLYVTYKQENTKIEIRPFGLELGLKNVQTVVLNHLKKEMKTTLHLTSPPLSQQTFDKLNPKGFCRTAFGTKLISRSYVYYLKNVPKPIRLPKPISNSIIYKVAIHPIIGIYSISAWIRPENLKGSRMSDWQWYSYVNQIVKDNVLDVLIQIYL